MDRLHKIEGSSSVAASEDTIIAKTVHKILGGAGAIPLKVVQRCSVSGNLELEAVLGAAPDTAVENRARWMLSRFGGIDPTWSAEGVHVRIGFKQTPPDDAFELLGIEYREDTYSDLFAQAFRHVASFRTGFLASLKLEGAASDWTCRVRPTATLAGTQTSAERKKVIPDVVIFSRSLETLVVVENKVLSMEGPKQTETYARADALDSLAKELGVKRAATCLVYLTLDGDAPAAPSGNGEKFSPMPYENLIKWLPEKGETPLTRLLVTWRGRIAEASEWPEPLDSSHVPSYLATHFGLATDRRIFRKLIQAIRPACKLLPAQREGASNNANGPVLLAQWMAKGWEQDGESIHLEFQWLPDVGAVKLHLHHETFPYVGHRSLTGDKSRFAEHEKRRYALQSTLVSHRDAFKSSGWKMRNHKWAVASYVFAPHELTTARMRERMSELAAAAVDAVGTR